MIKEFSINHGVRFIGIMGTPITSGNRGVLALGASLTNLCASYSVKSEPLLFLGHKNNQNVTFRVDGKTHSIKVVNCRLSPHSRYCDHLVWIAFAAILYRVIPIFSLRKTLSRFTPWLSALEKSVFVGDIRGGDSFSDIYGINRFLYGFVLAMTVLLVKGEMVQFPQTFGPFKSTLARWLARHLLKRSSIVIARDRNSRKLAQALIGSKKAVWLSPDVAFSLESSRPDSIEMEPPLKGLMPSKIIGININGLMYNGGYTRKNMFGLKLDYPELLPVLLVALLSEHKGELWLMPHVYAPAGNVESDPEACKQVRKALPEKLQNRVRILTGEYDQHEIKGVIGGCDFFIGSRMHACIAALSQGIPCVGIAYSMKFEGVFDTVGMKEWVIDGRTETNQEAIDRILYLYRKRDSVRDALSENADQARKRLQEIFQKLISSAACT